MDEEILIRFLRNQCTTEEVDRISRWIAADKANADRFFEMEHLWSLKDEQRYAERHEISAAYKLLLSKIRQREYPQRRKYRISPRRFSYAAILFLLGLLSITIYMSRGDGATTRNIIEVPNGQHASLTLSDGTRVCLNSGSRLVYPSDFSGEERVVELTGEGYFEVTKKGDSPFIVTIPSLSVKVLGTRFNVRAYPGEDDEVTLERGKVEVYLDIPANGRQGNRLALRPNQRLVYTVGREVSIDEVNPADETSWTTGGFSFDNRPLGHIMRELERRFNVRIHMQDEQLSQEIFTCHTEAGASLERILDALRNTGGLTYVRDENKIIVLTPKMNMPMKK